MCFPLWISSLIMHANYHTRRSVSIPSCGYFHAENRERRLSSGNSITCRLHEVIVSTGVHESIFPKIPTSRFSSKGPSFTDSRSLPITSPEGAVCERVDASFACFELAERARRLGVHSVLPRSRDRIRQHLCLCSVTGFASSNTMTGVMVHSLTRLVDWLMTCLGGA